MAKVIDYDEALNQVDNDEEFLVELLDDFKIELTSKMAILTEKVRVSVV